MVNGDSKIHRVCVAILTIACLLYQPALAQQLGKNMSEKSIVKSQDPPTERGIICAIKFYVSESGTTNCGHTIRHH